MIKRTGCTSAEALSIAKADRRTPMHPGTADSLNFRSVKNREKPL